MATCQETIKEALAALRIIPMGRNPSAAQSEDALKKLQRMVDSFVGFGGSYPVLDVQVSESIELDWRYPAQRLLCQHGSALTITLPEGASSGYQISNVTDGFRIQIVDVNGVAATYPITLARNGWKIAGSAANVILNTAGVNRSYVFRGDLGDWKQVSDLALADSLPFPSEFDDGLAMLLAMRLVGQSGQALGKMDVARGKACRDRLSARYAPPLQMRPDISASLLGGRQCVYGYDGSLSDFLNGNS